MVISGKDLAAEMKANMAQQIEKYNIEYGRKPGLIVILVGEDPGSVSYVTGKAKAAAEVGIENQTVTLPATISQDELLALVEKYNQDETIDGILVQLPLPKHIDSDLVLNAIRQDKDVDGFHPLNVAGLWLKAPCVYPCTPKGIIKLIKSKNIEIEGKNAVVIGRSNIVGLPAAKLLIDQNATVTICHSRTKDLAKVCAGADILVAAIGKPKFVKENMVKEGAVVIDVGVNRDPETGKLCGDVDFEAVEPKASYITKVPGGVGPMTIACLMENTIECYLNHVKKG